MQLTRWTPQHRLMNRHNLFPGLVDDFFSPRDNRCAGQVNSFAPSVDIYEKEDKIFFEAELPGFKKEDISVNVKGKIVTISGERKQQKEEGNSFQKEIRYGKFERSFQLAHEAESDSVKARYEDGILTLEIPKPEELQVKQIEIN